MEQFLGFFLFYKWFINFIYVRTQLDNKDNDWIKWASNIKHKRTGDLIYGALDCPFCRESHLGVIAAIPLAVAMDNYYYLFFGWLAKGLDITLDEFKNKFTTFNDN